MITILLTISLVLAGTAPADLSADAEPTPTTDTPRVDADAATRGGRLYQIYCTSCHGKLGRGDGPAAQGVTPLPTDLTRLSRENGGKFPTARVMLSIDGRRPMPGHGEGAMPIWGLSLQEPDGDYYQEDTVRKKIQDLVSFVETLQRPAVRPN